MGASRSRRASQVMHRNEAAAYLVEYCLCPSDEHKKAPHSSHGVMHMPQQIRDDMLTSLYREQIFAQPSLAHEQNPPTYP